MSVEGQLLFEEHQAHPLPMWREALLGVDWIKLRSSRVYYGFGVPKGDRSAVVVVPGFLGYDAYLAELYAWLWRIRYKPYMSRIGHNADCPNILVDRLIDTVRKAHAKTGKRVHLIGHSLGGVISRGAASLHPELIDSVVTLGSPIRGIRAHPWVLEVADLVKRRIHRRGERRPSHKPLHDDCFTASCDCPFSNTLKVAFPKDVAQTAVYTKTDGIVDWEMCMTDDPDVDVEVTGTHCGLAWNPGVYTIVAERLAEVVGR